MITAYCLVLKTETHNLYGITFIVNIYNVSKNVNENNWHEIKIR